MDFLRPTTWAEALAAKAERPDAVPVAGGTDVMVELNFDRRRPPALLDLTAVRNAYGTQVDSFAARVDPGADPAFAGLRCVFIRAPRLRAPGPAVEVLARVDGEPVLVRQGRILAATFHPELTEDPRVHAALVSLAAR